MNKRLLWTMGLVLFMTLPISCDLFSSREKRTDRMVAREMERMDWNAVDHYPLFEACDELMTRPTQKKCFENTLTSYLHDRIKNQGFILKDTVEVIVYMDLLVDREGTIKIADIERNDLLLEQLPDFNRLIQREINALPQIEPALKQGVPVNVKFRIPIVLNAN